MIKEEFIERNLIKSYKSAFESVWQDEKEDSKNLKQISVILKHLEKEKETFKKIIKSLLNSNDFFEVFIGAYLGICFDIEKEICNNKFNFFSTYYKSKSKESIEGKIYFYVETIKAEINEKGYISAYKY